MMLKDMDEDPGDKHNDHPEKCINYHHLKAFNCMWSVTKISTNCLTNQYY